MKKLKRFLASLMVTVMVLTAAPLSGFVGMELNLDWFNFDWLDFNTKASAASYSGTCGGSLTWTLDTETGELVISGTGMMTDYSKKYSYGNYYSTAPWASYNSVRNVTIQNGVTSIGDDAFYYCTGVENITIPDSVTSIGDEAFYCTRVENITIPDSVTSIGDSAFHYTSYYDDSSNWEDDVLYISNHLIDAKESLSGVYAIKDGTKSIANSAFVDCTNLTSITIPHSVTSIGSSAFYNCTSLTDVYYTGTIAEWCAIKFTSITSHPMNYAKNLYINGTLVKGDLVIPDNVTRIRAYAFYNCTSLTSITIPDSVTSIGNRAFYNCTELARVTIGNGVTSIGYFAFCDCSGITELTLPISAKIHTDMTGYAPSFDGCTNIERITLTKGNGTAQNYGTSTSSSATDTYYGYTPWYISSNSLKELVIEDGVTGIGSYTFYGCTGLTSITIPDSVKSIGEWAFYDCTELARVTIGDGVTSIGYNAFSSCTRLTSIIIPNSVTSIGVFAFSGCTSLTSITIGNGITSIGNKAFSNCEKLEEVIFTGDSVVSFGEEIFYGSLKAMICCEENSYLHTYAESNNIKFCLLDENGVPSFVVQNDVLLSYRGESTDVFISAGTKIGYGAFENNSIVETVVLSSSVSRIHANAFKNCASLTTVIIPESVTSIGAGAFDGCDNITIWCYAGSYADSYAAANGIDVEYIALDIEKDILILTLSGTSSLTASLNTPFVENAGVVWSSTNTSIATVDQNGVVKGIKAGTTVIVATSKDGELRDYCVVKVVGIEALSTATIDHENGFIMGLSSNLDTLDSYVEISDPACNLSYDSLGTDSIVYVECDGEIVDAYSVIIFGDVNGDSWYDGQDAIIVSCLANGMLTKDDVGEAVYTAADCNHDGVIDQLDVDLLNQAGTLLANVDQTKPTEVLLETSSEYVEFLDLIDQSPEIEIEDDTDTPEADVETEDTIPGQDTKVDVFGMIMNFIRYIIEMILSRIPVPYR